MSSHLIRRPRRNRSSFQIRELVAETRLSLNDLVQPLFVTDEKSSSPIPSLPEQKRFCLDELIKEVQLLSELGLSAVALFPAINESKKRADAGHAFDPDNINLQAIAAIKRHHPNMLVIGDVALDPYSSDGHDGIVDLETGEIMNDETLAALKKMALAQAKAGADFVAPSDMMDGRVGVIREALDAAGFQKTGILSYTAKYASSFYGPFRDALQSAPKSGDKKTYQMDYRNGREALLEASLDVNEGADIIMVKPGMPYLDVIYRIKQSVNVPVAAYQVSGEYSMIKLAIKEGIMTDESVLESLHCLKRAGADLIFTYFAKEYAQTIQKAE